MVKKNQQFSSSMLDPWEMKRRDKVAEQKEQSGTAAMNAHYDTEEGLLTLPPSPTPRLTDSSPFTSSL